MAFEDHRRRLGKLLAGDASGRMHIATEWPRMDEGGDGALRRWLEAHPDARLVVDILKRVRPRTSPTTRLWNRCRGHLRKMGATDPVDEISGSTGLSGGADGVLVLKRDCRRTDVYPHVTG